MTEKKEENVILESCREGTTRLCYREKALLWPILESLGVEKKKWEKFKYWPDQLVGLSISCIKEQEREIKKLRKLLKDLQWQYAKVCQASMDYKRCPLGTEEKT